MYNQKDGIIQEILQNRFGEELLSEEFQYCLEHHLSLKERQVIEMLAEGYMNREIYALMKNVFPTFHAYKMCKVHAKKKILNFLL